MQESKPYSFYFACSADIPMLVAGDFNSIPGSAAHSLLVKGKVEPSQLVSTWERDADLWVF